MVVIEADSKGRLTISAMDDDGYGHGYRIAGPKHIYDQLPGDTKAKVVVDHELDERDVKEIRIYLKIWDEIQARKASEPNEDGAA